jgi:hypothetical protein
MTTTSRRDHIAALLALVAFADPMKYTFHVVFEDDPESYVAGAHYIQASYMDEDAFKPGVMTEQRTRLWHIADDATDSQIIQTVFKMCLTSAEHRVREAFQYDGERIFGPHFDVNDLVELSRRRRGKGAPGKDFVWK